MLRSKKLFAFAAAGALVLAACGSDDDSSSDTTTAAGTEAPAGTGRSGRHRGTGRQRSTNRHGGAADTEATATPRLPPMARPSPSTSACDDPDAATAPIEGNIKIGTSIPLSGGPAVLFAPFGAGMQAYIDYYNTENGGINGQQLEFIITDDQYTADLTKCKRRLVDLRRAGRHVRRHHRLAEQPGRPGRPTAQCSRSCRNATGAPNWGDVEDNPWTSGLLVPYAIEAEVWAQYVAETYGEGATVGMFTVNNEFGPHTSTRSPRLQRPTVSRSSPGVDRGSRFRCPERSDDQHRRRCALMRSWPCRSVPSASPS